MKRTQLYFVIIVVVVFIQLVEVSSTALAESCEADSNGQPCWNRMEVLPGTGWDNLRNMDMGLVFEYDYTNCQLTNDRKYLLPDGCFAIPVQQSDVETFSEFIEHWENHTSLTATSINIEASYYSKINAKFSADFIKTKTTMHNEQSSIARVQMRYKQYIVRLQSGTNLHPMFKVRLLDIASQIMNNNTHIARYLAELLVRDYGTHYVTAVHAGAILAQEDYILNEFIANSKATKRDITASVSANFFGEFSLGTSISHTTQQNFSKSYLSNRAYSHIRTHGGPPYEANFTVNQWVKGLADSLVAIDREGVPLHFAIIPEVLSELPPTQTLELAHYVENAINSYYKHNTRFGCTNPNATNFYFAANVDDKSCEAPSNNFTFGGIFQICTADNQNDTVCPALRQKNPLTGNYSCPPHYMPVLLHSGAKSGVYTTSHCKEHCHLHVGWSVSLKCHHDCADDNHPITGHYETYWCVATGVVPDQSGFLFGGLYSSTASNPLTKAMSCPSHYYPLRFGQDTQVCVSDDYELGYHLSAPFAGFESCRAGNPLATQKADGTIKMSFGKLSIDPNTWPHRCPTGYTQHLASMEQFCEINYCVKAGTLDDSGLPPIKLPPYRKYPSLNEHTYNVISIISGKGNMWIQDNITKQWIKQPQSHIDAINIDPTNSSQLPPSSTSQPISGNDHNEDDTGTSPTTAALIISSTALLGLIIVVAIYGLCKYKGHKKKVTAAATSSYENLEQTNASIEMEPTADV
ncbi:macrophage-expressed gene 1 protein-like [Dysidea avara]|uniref:macrophage-expressed gene 1 protein-like n=1 Tax=Dysidea avara TaxID=196820 RepID=UPI0033332B21